MRRRPPLTLRRRVYLWLYLLAAAVVVAGAFTYRFIHTGQSLPFLYTLIVMLTGFAPNLYIFGRGHIRKRRADRARRARWERD